MRRNAKIAPWDIIIQGACFDADWQEIFAAHDEATGTTAASDPFDGPHRT
jgi:hypothetical protein